MRDHGLIRKTPNQRSYLLTTSGQTLTTALNALLAVSTQQLVKVATESITWLARHFEVNLSGIFRHNFAAKKMG